jgi:hypothetical protein
MLESLGVQSFSLKLEGGDVVVQGWKPAEVAQPVEEKPLRWAWNLLRGKQAEPREQVKPSSTVVELRYTPQDIARLKAEGQSQRDAVAGAAEAHALSQILRAVGAFVDEKHGRLVAVSKHDQTITIEYESALKEHRSEVFTVATFYDFWVHMYLRRKDRSE